MSLLDPLRILLLPLTTLLSFLFRATTTLLHAPISLLAALEPIWVFCGIAIITGVSVGFVTALIGCAITSLARARKGQQLEVARDEEEESDEDPYGLSGHGDEEWEKGVREEVRKRLMEGKKKDRKKGGSERRRAREIEAILEDEGEEGDEGGMGGEDEGWRRNRSRGR